ncbi:MAG: sulfatase [Planctomycetota bacterium]
MTDSSGPMDRREFLRDLMAVGTGGVAAGIAAARLALGQDQAKGNRPNILFIMSDDHAAHAISCYGSKVNKTPNLDRIASEGMRFDNCFCTNSICAPSRAVILTGKYSHLNGVINNAVPFDGSQQTFPKVMQQSGYTTAIVGKWHLKTDPTGFDYWNILPGQGAYRNPEMIETGEKKKHEGYVTDIITDQALDWLNNKRDKTKPFCLMLHHKAPHRNWQPDEKHEQLFANVNIPEPETFNDDYANRASAAREAAMRIDKDLTRSDVKQDPPPGLSESDLKKWKYQRYMRDYLACVASVDDNVGRVLDYLNEAGLTRDTIVVYTSDQGFYLGDHNWFDKRFMYEESLRMPFLIRYPREIKAGTVNGDMLLNVDFAPTFLDYASAAIPEDMQGRSARPLFQVNTPADWRTSMYYHYYEYPGGHTVKRHYGVRTKRYKLIHYYNDIDEWELFDLEKDPHELKSVYSDPAYAEVVRELKTELARLQKEVKLDDSAEKAWDARPTKAKKVRKGPEAKETKE